MLDLTPQKPNPKVLVGLMIAAGLFTIISIALALLDDTVGWRHTIIGLLCMVSLLLTWSPWKKNK